MGYGPIPPTAKTYSVPLETIERTIYPWSLMQGIVLTEDGIRAHYSQYGFDVLKVEHDPYTKQLHVDVRRPDHPQIMKFGFYIGDLELSSKRCNHEFKEYHGFTESYRYCTKCDHKETT